MTTTDAETGAAAVVDDRPLPEVIADTCERAEQVDDDGKMTAEASSSGPALVGPIAEVTVTGKEPQLVNRRDCPHQSLTFQNVAGTVPDENDKDKIGKWVLRVRVRCSICAVPFDVVPGSARDPQDHPIGIVFDLLPVEDRDLVESLPVSDDAP